MEGGVNTETKPLSPKLAGIQKLKSTLGNIKNQMIDENLDIREEKFAKTFKNLNPDSEEKGGVMIDFTGEGILLFSFFAPTAHNSTPVMSSIQIRGFGSKDDWRKQTFQIHALDSIIDDLDDRLKEDVHTQSELTLRFKQRGIEES